ncbi:AI-2E family transporter [Anaerolineae bacterium CFX9]|nr:AI-2E family transporter [Geitlerinema splendidum]MDL1900826.1 AI-2E family transporter [Anaerolineae bacterium CFX9]
MSTRPEHEGLQFYTADWGTWTRRVAAIGLIIAGVYAVSLLGPVFSTTVLAVLLAFALFYPVRAVVLVLRLPYALSVLLVFVIYIFIVVFVVLGLSGTVITFLITLTQQALERLSDVLLYLRTWQPGDTPFLDPSGSPLQIDFILEPLSGLVRSLTPDAVDSSEAVSGFASLLNYNPSAFNVGALNIGGLNLTSLFGTLSGTVGGALGTVSGALGTVSGAVGNFVLVHFLALLFMLEIPRMFKAGIDATAEEYRREMAILASRIAAVWTGFFRSQLFISTMVGVFTWLQFSLMGVPGAVVVGLTTGFVSLIPLLGGLFSLFPIALVPLFQGSTVFVDMPNGTLMLLVLVINFIFQQVIWNLVAPMITGDAVKLPVPVIILGLFVGTSIAGVLGALLAAPVLGILRVIVDYIIRKIRGGDPYPGEEMPAFMTRGLFRELVQELENREEKVKIEEQVRRMTLEAKRLDAELKARSQSEGSSKPDTETKPVS